MYPVVILTVQLFFTIGNGTRQGGILSPYLFSRYIRELLLELETSRVCCCIGGEYINVLAYADDIVVLAPSWRGLQQLLSVLGDVLMLTPAASAIDVKKRFLFFFIHGTFFYVFNVFFYFANVFIFKNVH